MGRGEGVALGDAPHGNRYIALIDQECWGGGWVIVEHLVHTTCGVHPPGPCSVINYTWYSGRKSLLKCPFLMSLTSLPTPSVLGMRLLSLSPTTLNVHGAVVVYSSDATPPLALAHDQYRIAANTRSS